MATFEKVTGPKTEDWLVKTVGETVLVIGLALLWACYRRRFSEEIVLLAVLSSAALLLVEVVYVAKRVIGPVYLLDALAQVALLVGWGLAWLRGATG